MKALSQILSIESAGKGGLRHPLPTKEVLQSLAEGSRGDIRSAINALQFATKKGKEGMSLLVSEVKDTLNGYVIQ